MDADRGIRLLNPYRKGGRLWEAWEEGYAAADKPDEGLRDAAGFDQERLANAIDGIEWPEGSSPLGYGSRLWITEFAGRVAAEYARLAREETETQEPVGDDEDPKMPAALLAADKPDEGRRSPRPGAALVDEECLSRLRAEFLMMAPPSIVAALVVWRFLGGTDDEWDARLARETK